MTDAADAVKDTAGKVQDHLVGAADNTKEQVQK